MILSVLTPGLAKAQIILDNSSTDLVSRIYYVSPQVVEIPANDLHGTEKKTDLLSEAELSQLWMNYLSRKRLYAPSITWPAGASLKCITQPKWCLYIQNTAYNIQALDQWFEALSIPPNAIEVSLNAFKKDDIEHLKAEGCVTKEKLFELRKRSKSKLVSTLKTRHPLRKGSDVELKDVQEIIYPSEYYYSNGCATNQNENGTIHVWPGDFTMRETGTIVKLTAQSDYTDSSFSYKVDAKLSYTTLVDWDEYDASITTKDKGVKTFPCTQPRFNCLSIEQTCTIIPGETVLLGGGSTFDTEWVYYAFLTLDIVPAKKIVLE
jgi:hypothetical protein